MKTEFTPSCRGLLFSTTLILAVAACGDDGGGNTNTDTDSVTDAGDEDEMDASVRQDASAPRDAAREATVRDSAVTTTPDADVDAYTCEPPPPPDGKIAAGQACCSGLGTCVAPTGDAGSTLGFGDCNAAEELRCQPLAEGADAGAGDAGAADGGAVRLATCRLRTADTPDGGAGYEGRCVPECLTRGVSNLQRGDCNEDFVCVPCYSPITGSSTDVCNRPGDKPVEPAPPGFDECGETQGYCVSVASIGDAGTTLQQLTCGEDERCVPKPRVTSPDACFARCESAFGPGACIAEFLVPMASRTFLQPATCASGELCSPCVNPTTMMPTGACN